MLYTEERPLTYGEMKKWLESRGVRDDSIMLNVVDVNFHPGPNMVAIFLGDQR